MKTYKSRIVVTIVVITSLFVSEKVYALEVVRTPRADRPLKILFVLGHFPVVRLIQPLLRSSFMKLKYFVNWSSGRLSVYLSMNSAGGSFFNILIFS